MDIENTANPYRFYGISGGSCTIGINLVHARGMEFHGASFWGTSSYGISVTGSMNEPDGYILFDGLQVGPTQAENMYLDQTDTTVICAANCLFGNANSLKQSNVSAIRIGPDAASLATGISPIVLQLDQGCSARSFVCSNPY